MFVANVMEQTVGEERVLCGNQLASRVLELLLPAAETKVLDRFCSALGSDLRLACMDSFMSHVLEKLLLLRAFREEEEQELEEQELEEAGQWVVKICRFVTNNLEDFCLDTYASHLLRTATECLVGKRAEDEKKGNAQTEGYSKRVVARACNGQEKEDVLESFTIRIMALSPELCTSELCVRVLQVCPNLV